MQFQGLVLLAWTSLFAPDLMATACTLGFDASVSSPTRSQNSLLDSSSTLSLNGMLDPLAYIDAKHLRHVVVFTCHYENGTCDPSTYFHATNALRRCCRTSVSSLRCGQHGLLDFSLVSKCSSARWRTFMCNSVVRMEVDHWDLSLVSLVIDYYNLAIYPCTCLPAFVLGSACIIWGIRDVYGKVFLSHGKDHDGPAFRTFSRRTWNFQRFSSLPFPLCPAFGSVILPHAMQAAV